MKARVKRFVKLWVDLFDRHLLLDHASAIAFNMLKALVPLTLLGLAVLGAAGGKHVWTETLFPRVQQHLQPATAHAINASRTSSTSAAAGLRSHQVRLANVDVGRLG